MKRETKVVVVGGGAAGVFAAIHLAENNLSPILLEKNHSLLEKVLLTGGVAANKRLQTMIKIISEEHEAKFSVVPLEFATDNGAMIAWTGIVMHQSGLTTKLEDSGVRQRFRTDEVDLPWMPR